MTAHERIREAIANLHDFDTWNHDMSLEIYAAAWSVLAAASTYAEHSEVDPNDRPALLLRASLREKLTALADEVLGPAP